MYVCVHLELDSILMDFRVPQSNLNQSIKIYHGQISMVAQKSTLQSLYTM